MGIGIGISGISLWFSKSFWAFLESSVFLSASSYLRKYSSFFYLFSLSFSYRKSRVNLAWSYWIFSRSSIYSWIVSFRCFSFFLQGSWVSLTSVMKSFSISFSIWRRYYSSFWASRASWASRSRFEYFTLFWIKVSVVLNLFRTSILRHWEKPKSRIKYFIL